MHELESIWRKFSTEIPNISIVIRLYSSEVFFIQLDTIQKLQQSVV
jgi:hypothetical protein